MDLNGAEKAVNKLLTYIQSLADSDARLYDKSKQKLKDISSNCIQVIGLVTQILQSEILEEEDQEFESTPDKELQDQVIQLSDEIDKIRTFVQLDPIGKSYHGVDSKYINTPYTLKDKLSSSDKKKIVVNYKECLYNMYNSSYINIPKVKSLCDILWKWFDKRILTQYSNAPPFHYGIHRLKSIIYAIVIRYGYSIESNDVDRFIYDFDMWLDRLGASKDSNRWIAPYDIYQIERKLDKQYVNLTSVILWDILLDNGLNNLCEMKNNSDLYPSKNEVWNMTQNVNPDILDSYSNYKEDPSILKNLNIL